MPSKTTTKTAGRKTGTTTAPNPTPPAKPGAKMPAWTASKDLTIGKTKASVARNDAGRATLTLVRTINAPADRIYACFLDPDAYAKWLPPHGFSGKVHKLDAKVGGKFSMSFSTIGRKATHGFGGEYKELVPGKRIVLVERFDDPSFGAGDMTVTIDLKPVKGGTEVHIVQANIPPGPASEGAPYGWSQSLDNLAALCEVDFLG